MSDKKQQPKKKTRIERFYDKFRSKIVSQGKSRSDRRKAYKQATVKGKQNHGRQAERKKGRRKAKIKARNRRNRKLARALHQRERN